MLYSEILDTRTKPLITIDSSNTADYISSNSMVLRPIIYYIICHCYHIIFVNILWLSLKQISMSIAMVSELREVNVILKELLTAEGNEL